MNIEKYSCFEITENVINSQEEIIFSMLIKSKTNGEKGDGTNKVRIDVHQSNTIDWTFFYSSNTILSPSPG